jgi:hypothetical protein
MPRPGTTLKKPSARLETDQIQLLRWRLISAFDVITEGLLVVLTVFIVWPVQLSLELKLQVIIAFAFRLPSVKQEFQMKIYN